MAMVSVIIPNYNHAQYLEARIRSVLDQTMGDFELILLDDASTDQSVSILEQYSTHTKTSQLIINQENSGSPFSQWQKGLAVATGKWIWIAESDDLADPLFLSTALRQLDQQPDASLFYSDAVYLPSGNEPVPFGNYAQPKNQYFNTGRWSENYMNAGIAEINFCLKKACTINNISSVVFRKSILEEAIKDAEHFRFHGDWFCLLKACSLGHVLYSHQCLNQFRMKSNSLLTGDNKLQSQLEYFRILDWILQQHFVSNKKDVLDYFILNYCGYGWISDGPRYGSKLINGYRSINPLLAKQLRRRLFSLKLSGKKRNPLF